MPNSRSAPGLGRREPGRSAAPRQPADADAEHAAAGDPADPGLHVHPAFDARTAPFTAWQGRWPVLREQVNSHVEMAYASPEAGFRAFDVHMTRPAAGRVDAQNQASSPAGFSYGDTLGAGIGWGGPSPSIRYWLRQFRSFLRQVPLAWACNGCQMFAELADIIPGAQDWLRFTT